MSSDENSEGDVVDSSDEDEEGLDEYEDDGFILRDGEEEDEGDEDREEHRNEERRKKHKKSHKRKKHLDLLPEDEDLLQEALGVKDRYKRLKKRKTDEDDLTSQLFSSSEDEVDTSKSRSKSSGRREQSISLSRNRESDQEDFDSDEDELDNFIEDETRDRKRKKPPNSISAHLISEANEIFGDYSEFMSERTAEREGDISFWKGQSKLALYSSQFEPSVLGEKFITEADEKIRKTDIPERHQLRALFREPGEDEISQEAKWIYNRLFQKNQEESSRSSSFNPENQSNVIKKITDVLNYIRNDHYEVPFISQYRKEHWKKELTPSDLWEIYDLDLRWQHFLNRKEHLTNLYNNWLPPSDKLSEEESREDYLKMILQADLEEELNDLYDHLILHSPETESHHGPSSKRPARRNTYIFFKSSPIGIFAKEFGLTAQQFGESLMSDFQTQEPVDPDIDPSEGAEEMIKTMESSRGSSIGTFSNIENVLKAARHVLAVEIANEPRVRGTIRKLYQKRAVVSSFPTDKGKKEIDCFHEFKSVKRIDRKPVEMFDGTSQFLEMELAEREGLIRIEINLDGEKMMEEISHLYLSSKSKLTSQKWNEQRKMILSESMTKYVFPLLQRELRAKLIDEAKKIVVNECEKKLREICFVKPFRPSEHRSSHRNRHRHHDDREEPDVCIMSIVFGSSTESSMVAILDEEGEILEHHKVKYLDLRINKKTNLGDCERKQESLKQIKDLITNKQPSAIVIVVNPGDVGITTLRDEISECIPSDIPKPFLTYIDGSVSRIYRVSPRAERDFPGYPELLKQSISAGRYFLDPLSEVTGLEQEKDELSCLNLHPLQSSLGKEYLLDKLRRSLVNMVCEVGVDINRIILHSHTNSQLQFVAGLGPRKSMNLIQELSRRGGKINSREELEQFLGQNVYTNCIGFLRIRRKYFADLNDFDPLDPLDDTRIHPEDYPFAKKMVLDASEQDDDPDEEQLRALVEQAIENKSLEKILDLNTFAEEWERMGKGKKKDTLFMISDELKSPFRDPRSDFIHPHEKELFRFIFGKGCQVGQLITARVVSIRSSMDQSGDSVFCNTELDLPGTIRATDLSDNLSENINSRVSVGMDIFCRIIEINEKTMSLILSSKSSVLAKNPNEDRIWEELRHKDRYFVYDPEQERLELEEEERKQKRKSASKYQRRQITHPYFKNCSSEEASKELLESPDDISYLIRPSSKGPNFLTITWKMFSRIVHISITEKDKQQDHPFALGRTLMIGQQKFEDLDELLARYMDPMVLYCSEMGKYRRFYRGKKEEVESMLRSEKKNTPSRIPYAIRVSDEENLSGRFVLCYVPGSTSVRMEYITPTPDGFRFRGKLYTDPENLVQNFKKMYSQGQREPPPSHSSSSSPSYSSMSVPKGSHNISNQSGNSHWSESNWGSSHGPPSGGMVPVSSGGGGGGGGGWGGSGNGGWGGPSGGGGGGGWGGQHLQAEKWLADTLHDSDNPHPSHFDHHRPPSPNRHNHKPFGGGGGGRGRNDRGGGSGGNWQRGGNNPSGRNGINEGWNGNRRDNRGGGGGGGRRRDWKDNNNNNNNNNNFESGSWGVGDWSQTNSNGGSDWGQTNDWDRSGKNNSSGGDGGW